MDRIQEGDNVWLKGQRTSPKMTVESIGERDVTCVWFDTKMEYNRKIFRVTSLTKEEPTK